MFGEDAVANGTINKNNAWSICFIAIIVLNVLMPNGGINRRLHYRCYKTKAL